MFMQCDARCAIPLKFVERIFLKAYARPTLVGAMILAVAAMVATSGIASASDTPGIKWDHIYTAPGAKVYVKEHGDIISLCDTSANGHSAELDIVDYGALSARGGAGSCDTSAASSSPFDDLVENATIDIWFDGEGDPPYAGWAHRSFFNDH